MYATIAEIRAEGVTEDMATDQRLEELILEATVYIDKVTRWWFGARQKTMKIDGTGHDTIWIPVPIIEVTEVKVEGRTLNTEAYVVYNRREPDDRLNPKIVRFNHWPKGEQIVEVVGTFGYTDEHPVTQEAIVPLAIKRVCRQLVIREIPTLMDIDGQEEKRRARIVSETTDMHSYTLSQLTASGEWTGDPEIDTILWQYRRPVGVAAV